MAKVTGGAGQDVLEHEVRIAASPTTVFSYLVDPTRMVRWMGKDATVEPRPGGAFRIAYERGDVVRGEVLEVSPPERLLVSWGWEAEGDATPPGSSQVEFTLEPEGEGTIVRVRHSGLVEDARAGHAEGWDYFMPRLATAAEAA